MKTSATNKKIREIITKLKDKTLIPNPDFQRNLVWSNKHKLDFIDTILKGYPFPEIYIAAGSVDPETAAGTDLLVDGQQRVMTIFQYFINSSELKLGKEIPPYPELSNDQKGAFLEYEVVVRDLGKLPIEEIREVFKRINLTQYSLNSMEVHNARFDGALKTFVDNLAQESFFEQNGIFSTSDIRRMGDKRFVLMIVITTLSTYFNRDDELEIYLQRYNDEFPHDAVLLDQLKKVFEFIDACGFDPKSRVWNKADLLTLVVELHRAMFKEKNPIQSSVVAPKLKEFYRKIESKQFEQEKNNELNDYYQATLQANSDRGNRIKRGAIISKVIKSAQLELNV